MLLLSRFSVQLHGWQPTRLPHPWDSPGKNTGVGCHFLLRCMKVKSEIEVAQSHPTLCDPMDCSLPGSSAHGIFQARVLEWVAVAFSSTYLKSSHFLSAQSWNCGWNGQTCSESPFVLWVTCGWESFPFESESVSLSVVCNSLWPPWTVALQAPLSMECSRQESWSVEPFRSPGYRPNPGVKPGSPALTGRFFSIWVTRAAFPFAQS